jgi:hypothetical protein
LDISIFDVANPCSFNWNFENTLGDLPWSDVIAEYMLFSDYKWLQRTKKQSMSTIVVPKYKEDKTLEGIFGQLSSEIIDFTR